MRAATARRCKGTIRVSRAGLAHKKLRNVEESKVGSKMELATGFVGDEKLLTGSWEMKRQWLVTGGSR